MIAIATASQKGGVGKTTLCINLAYSLARRGWRVLLIDTDPQGGVGLSLAKSTKAREGFHEFLIRGGDLNKIVVPTRLPELEIVPAGQYDTCARQGWSVHEVPARLADLLRGAELRGVDVVLMDTAAGMNSTTEAVVKACDFVVLPQQAEPLAIRSVPHLLETLARFRAEGAGVRVAGILLTMVMREQEMSLKVARELREMLPANLMFQQSIPRLPSFLEASALGVPVALTKRNPPPEALIFDQIAAELEQRTGLVKEREKEQGHASLLD
ncbi:ParA family protein [Prosthecobacter sp.]|uniref:ParA family protein n=1 Tax=Prosthecobacter sp. TaxID=1965333 RepID=UPI002ABAAD5F|nr:ParA family protein [Prosthecobacter sp.]MDZ4405199.1 ParA family protein [Prosthecobacter sp.]